MQVSGKITPVNTQEGYLQHIRTKLDHDFEYLGGQLAADFANTQSFRYDPAQAHDHLGTYADLVDFVRQAGAMTPALARRLLARAERHPEEAAQVYRRALVLREAVWQTFSHLAHGEEPARSDIDAIGREAADANGHAELVSSAHGYEWALPETDDLARALWPIAQAATAVLSSRTERSFVRECASDECAWLFLDRSKSHTRRWCNMETCGNRAKQRRFQKRTTRVAR